MVLSGWNYRKSHVITSGTTLTDYQVRIRIYRSTGTDSDYNVYVGTKCLSNYNDIRFTTSDGNTLLPYWIEFSNSSYADVWIKLPSISTTTIYIYYGNENASAYSDGNTTFIFFDDFESGTISASKWPVGYSDYTASTVSPYQGTYSAYRYSTSQKTLATGTLETLSAHVIELSAKFTESNRDHFVIYSDKYLLVALYNGKWGYYNGSAYVYLTSYTSNTWYKIKLILNKNANTYLIYIDDSLIGTITGNALFNASAPTFLSLIHGTNGLASGSYFDIIRIRKWTANEPVHSTWGAEQYLGVYKFSYEPTSGDFPLIVSFEFFGKYITGFIDFGDGITSNSLSTSHIYTKPGSYDLLAIGNETDYYNLPNAITVTAPTVTSSFTYTTSNNVITFTDTSTGSVSEWLWNFGDENISFEQNPVHEYFAPGNYNVSLLVSNNYSNDLHTATITITNTSVFWPQSASFTYDQAKEDKICRVEFYGVSEPSIYTPNLTYSWNFGDGYTSTLQNPIHYYNNSGTYTVTFTVFNAYGNKSYTQEITVEEPVIINFTPSFTHGIAPHTVNFIDRTYPQEEVVSRLWNFGDTTTSEETNPSHIYTTEGIYSPSLSITYWGGTRTLTKGNSVIVNTKTYTFKETINFGEATIDDMEVKVFEDLISFPTETLAPGILLEDKIPFIQMEVPTTSGFDEFGYSYSRLFTHFGHRVINALTSFGRKIVRSEAINDRTGFSMANARVFRDTIYFESEANAEPAT